MNLVKLLGLANRCVRKLIKFETVRLANKYNKIGDNVLASYHKEEDAKERAQELANKLKAHAASTRSKSVAKARTESTKTFDAITILNSL